MNKKLAIYSIVALLTGSTIATLSINEPTNAHDQYQAQAPRPATTAPMSRQTNKSIEVDKSFIEMMIPHHQSANEMAEMALTRAKSPEVKKLAQSIVQDQSREIKQMQTWYKQWYGAEFSMTGMNTGMGMNMHNQMGQAMMMSMQQQEKIDQEMMDALKNASNFDQEFLRQMTRHHQMATMMAGMVANSATHPEIRNLAQNIVKTQSAEIAQMQQLSQAMKTSNRSSSN